MTQEDNQFIQNLKVSKVAYDENLEGNICKYIKKRINLNNVLLCYKIADFFNLRNVADINLYYIERCFTMVAETRKFLELDFTLVKKILSSSELEINSELEVFSAADNWISYNHKERSKFAKCLLLTVRLLLLSTSALNYLMCETSSF